MVWLLIVHYCWILTVSCITFYLCIINGVFTFCIYCCCLCVMAVMLAARYFDHSPTGNSVCDVTSRPSDHWHYSEPSFKEAATAANDVVAALPGAQSKQVCNETRLDCNPAQLCVAANCTVYDAVGTIQKMECADRSDVSFTFLADHSLGDQSLKNNGLAYVTARNMEASYTPASATSQLKDAAIHFQYYKTNTSEADKVDCIIHSMKNQLHLLPCSNTSVTQDIAKVARDIYSWVDNNSESTEDCDEGGLVIDMNDDDYSEDVDNASVTARIADCNATEKSAVPSVPSKAVAKQEVELTTISTCDCTVVGGAETKLAATLSDTSCIDCKHSSVQNGHIKDEPTAVVEISSCAERTVDDTMCSAETATTRRDAASATFKTETADKIQQLKQEHVEELSQPSCASSVAADSNGGSVAAHTDDDVKTGVDENSEGTERSLCEDKKSMTKQQLSLRSRDNFISHRMLTVWPSIALCRVGAGLQNLGNTCFVNATIQCLTYTLPLVNYLFTCKDSASCSISEMCLMCELECHMRECYNHSGSIVRPHSILQKLKVIARHMRWGRQEDAHEFLRYMVDAMHKSCVNGHQRLPENRKDISVVNEIFGGILRSQVTCLKCQAKSNTYDPFLDISLDVKNVSSIIRALERFVEPETLDTDNAYNCTKCRGKVRAQKRFTMHRLPHVLTIQLKRYGVMGGKVTRHITFPEVLDLRPFVSNHGQSPTNKRSDAKNKQSSDFKYRLYGVLVHEGHSTSSGHYYCYVATASGGWYCMNDHMVRRSSLGQVLSAEAYLLFYRRGLVSTASVPNSSISPRNAAIRRLPRGAVNNVCSEPGAVAVDSSQCLLDAAEACYDDTSTSAVMNNLNASTSTNLETNNSSSPVRQSVCLGGQTPLTEKMPQASHVMPKLACRGGQMNAASHHSVGLGSRQVQKTPLSSAKVRKNVARYRRVVRNSCRESRKAPDLSDTRTEVEPQNIPVSISADNNSAEPTVPRIILKIHLNKGVSSTVTSLQVANERAAMGTPSAESLNIPSNAGYSADKKPVMANNSSIACNKATSLDATENSCEHPEVRSVCASVQQSDDCRSDTKKSDLRLSNTQSESDFITSKLPQNYQEKLARLYKHTSSTGVSSEKSPNKHSMWMSETYMPMLPPLDGSSKPSQDFIHKWAKLFKHGARSSNNDTSSELGQQKEPNSLEHQPQDTKTAMKQSEAAIDAKQPVHPKIISPEHKIPEKPSREVTAAGAVQSSESVLQMRRPLNPIKPVSKLSQKKQPVASAMSPEKVPRGVENKPLNLPMCDDSYDKLSRDYFEKLSKLCADVQNSAKTSVGNGTTTRPVADLTKCRSQQGNLSAHSGTKTVTTGRQARGKKFSAAVKSSVTVNKLASDYLGCPDPSRSSMGQTADSDCKSESEKLLDSSVKGSDPLSRTTAVVNPRHSLVKHDHSSEAAVTPAKPLGRPCDVYDFDTGDESEVATSSVSLAYHRQHVAQVPIDRDGVPVATLHVPGAYGSLLKSKRLFSDRNHSVSSGSFDRRNSVECLDRNPKTPIVPEYAALLKDDDQKLALPDHQFQSNVAKSSPVPNQHVFSAKASYKSTVCEGGGGKTETNNQQLKATRTKSDDVRRFSKGDNSTTSEPASELKPPADARRKRPVDNENCVQPGGGGGGPYRKPKKICRYVDVAATDNDKANIDYTSVTYNQPSLAADVSSLLTVQCEKTGSSHSSLTPRIGSLPHSTPVAALNANTSGPVSDSDGQPLRLRICKVVDTQLSSAEMYVVDPLQSAPGDSKSELSGCNC